MTESSSYCDDGDGGGGEASGRTIANKHGDVMIGGRGFEGSFEADAEMVWKAQDLRSWE